MSGPHSTDHRFPGYDQVTSPLWFARQILALGSQAQCRDHTNMQICCQLTELLTDMGMLTLTPALASYSPGL